MSQKTINKSLQNNLLSPLTRDLLWPQFLTAFSYEIQNMRDKYASVRDIWNPNTNDKSSLIRISESFGYTPNLTIDNTARMSSLEVQSIPYRIKEKTTYNGYNLIFKQNDSLGDTFNYYSNGWKLIKAINYDDTLVNLASYDGYSPFLGIVPIKNFSSKLNNSQNMILDYLSKDGEKAYDDYGIRYYSLDQKFNPYWKLDTSYLKVPTNHLGIEYFPRTWNSSYRATLGLASEDVEVYETQIQYPSYYVAESMTIEIDGLPLSTTVESIDGKEYYRDENGILADNTWFDPSENLLHIEFNEPPYGLEVSASYRIGMLFTSDYFYYLEKGMEYNKRCTIVPHEGAFLFARVAEGRGSDFYFKNDEGWTIPDLKLKAVTSSGYNRYIIVSDKMFLDYAMDDQGQPSGRDNFKLDSLVKWTLDSETSQKESLISKFKYIACGNRALNVIDEKHNGLFNQTSILFYYNLDGENDSDKVLDLSLNSIDCTITGNTERISSVINKSLNFDGSTYARSSSYLNFDPSATYTMGMWFKAEEGGGTLFDCFTKIAYDWSEEKLTIGSSIEFPCSPNEYHFLCLAYDGTDTSVKIWLDDELQGDYSLTISSASFLVNIGADSSESNEFHGEIDDVWLLGKSITDEERSYIYDDKISLISSMGNRMSYYELAEDEKYNDDDYTIIQSYVKSMDINDEHVKVENNGDEIYSAQTRFHPILPSQFMLKFKNASVQDVTLYSNENGDLYKKDNTQETVDGHIDFESGVWTLAKNSIKSVTQETIIDLTDHGENTEHITQYEKLYEYIDENSEQTKAKWYSEDPLPTPDPSKEVEGDDNDFPSDREEEPVNSVFLWYCDDDTSNTAVYSNDPDNGNLGYYVKSSSNTDIAGLGMFTLNSDDDETPLFSYRDTKALYLTLADLIVGHDNGGSGQLRAFFDMGESSGTTIYSTDDVSTVTASTKFYLNVACSDNREIHKWTIPTEDGDIVGYSLGNSNVYYTNLLFNSQIENVTSPTNIAFTPMGIAVKSTQGELNLTLQKTSNFYENTYVRTWITEVDEDIPHEGQLGYGKELVKGSIILNYWIETSEGTKKFQAQVSVDGGVEGENIKPGGTFDYINNEINFEFETPVKSNLVASYQYYDSLEINYDYPISMTYKCKNSNKVNEIGLENENHELMAYMTFPDVEFYSTHDNLSAMFAISKSS